jgi:hypothetical protein
MVDAGVARNLPVEESFWTNDSGEPVETEAEAFRCRVDVDIEHPGWIFVETKWVRILTKTMMGILVAPSLVWAMAQKQI